jgi:hypothetical protein
MAIKVMLPVVRCSFLTLGEPKDYQGDKHFRWSAAFLVPKGEAIAKKVDKVIAEVATEKWGPKAPAFLKGILGNKNLCCWLDGDTKEYDGYEGMMALSAHRPVDKGRPLVIDNDKTPIYQLDNTAYRGKEGRVYSGCYVNAQVEIWAQDSKNGKAIRASLLVVQRVKDGDAFGGGSRPDADEFSEVEEGADADDMS